MGWGRHYGRMWGGQQEPASTFQLLRARASGSNSFRVTFNKPPKLDSPIDPGDSSQLTNWTLTREDKAQKLTILTVRAVTGDVNTIEFIIAERWLGALAEYRIAGDAALVDQTLQQSIATPAQADFFGAPEVIPQTERQEILLDVFNAQDSPDMVNGGLEVGTNGDYVLEAGLTMLKKLIVREIVTAQGEFLHLSDTDYGFGLAPKNFYTSVDLVTLQKRLRLRVARQPEVQSSRVAVELFPDGRLVVKIKAKTDFGSLEVSQPISGVGL